MSHRILIIGAGSIGERHLRCMQATGRAECGICEPADARRAEIADRYKPAGAYGSLDEALGDSWRAAIIAAPAQTHIPIARQVIAAGLDAYIEKPLAVTDEGVDELAAEAEAAGRTIDLAYVYRAHPAIVAMRQALAEGQIGPARQLVAVCGQDFAFYRPGYASTYYADRATGGGAVQDALTHVVNACEWLIGPVTAVAADAAHRGVPGVTVEDTVHVLARHGEVPASYTLNQYQSPNEISITVVGQTGTARMELHNSRFGIHRDPQGAWQWQEYPLADRDDWFTRQENHFCDVLEGKATPLCPLAEARGTLHVNQAILASALEARPLTEVNRD